MNEPKTRPGELSRISALANGDPYRTQVLLLLLEGREASKRHEQWQVAHDKLDNERHTNIVADIAGIKKSLGGAVSSVNDFEEARSQINGAKKLIIGTVAVLTAIGGVIYFVAWAIKELKP